MSEQKTFTSAHFPYIPVTVVLNKRIETVEALLDTGFDGDLIIPEGLMTNGKPPDTLVSAKSGRFPPSQAVGRGWYDAFLTPMPLHTLG